MWDGRPEISGSGTDCGLNRSKMMAILQALWQLSRCTGCISHVRPETSSVSAECERGCRLSRCQGDELFRTNLNTLSKCMKTSVGLGAVQHFICYCVIRWFAHVQRQCAKCL